MDSIFKELSNVMFDNGLVIVLGCTMIGMILKGTIKKLPNNLIPYINMVLAIALGYGIPDTLPNEDTISKVIELGFLGLSSTGLYEALCIVVKKRFSIDIPEIANKYLKPTKETEDPSKLLTDINEIIDNIETKLDEAIVQKQEKVSKTDTETSETDETAVNDSEGK